MSVNRENVIWKSRNGTWSRAFYDFYAVNQDDDDWDYEWDVEYTDDFNWVRTGLASEDAAHAAWDGANPGGYTLISEPDAYTDKLDEKAAAWLAANPPRQERWLTLPPLPYVR